MTTAAHDDLFATTTLTLHEQIGFELGWDYAHHGLQPPAPYTTGPSPLRHGLLAGQATFGARTLAQTRHVRKWLQLRLHAWLRGRSVELMQVTPRYLQFIDATHCPVTRVPLSTATLEASDASVDRVRNDAGYAAGNLAVMSRKANQAKAAHGFREALRIVRDLELGNRDGVDGLNAAQWARVAVLCSFVEPLAHEEAAALPLLALPPNRLRLFNPVQALQAFVSRQLLVPGWSQRITRFEALLPGKPSRRAFQMFFHALLPRVLEAGRMSPPGRPTGEHRSAQHGGPSVLAAHEARWAVEDAWRNALVMKRWTTFARLLSPAQCESLVERATARKLGTQLVERIADEAATEGWNLASRGYVPHAVLMKRGPRPAAPAAAQVPLPL